LLPELLQAWRRVGVPGATILPSAGGHDTEKSAKRGSLSTFLNLFDQGKSPQRTIISIIDDPEMLEVAIAEADRVVKGFDSPKSGILFTLPLGQVLGLQKWGAPHRDQEAKEEPEPEEKSAARLLQWFEEDVKGRYGEDALQDWSRQRNIPVFKILPLLDLHPTIVQMNTPLTEVMTQLLANPGVPAACVVNAEGRLMGVIPIKSLADVMMIPVMPEAYINDPEEYDKALQYAQITDQHIAAGVMKDPVFMHEEDTLEQVYQRMREHNLSGVPVVDKSYHVKGFITLLGLMAVCFPDRK
jgi:CBS domain-containing protein